MRNKRGKSISQRLRSLRKEPQPIDPQAFEVSTELGLFSRHEAMLDNDDRFDTGIDKKRVGGKRIGVAAHSIMGTAIAKTAPPPDAEPVQLKQGQKLIVYRYDRQNRAATWLLLGECVEMVNNILTLKTRVGKKLYVFNSQRYFYHVRKTRAYPTFSLATL